MINTQTLARPYAKAAFEFASAATDRFWSKMLNPPPSLLKSQKSQRC